jgi:TRAP-type uncharacterized transport system fused permease subunit
MVAYQLTGVSLMDVIVSAFAVLVALGCFIAIYMSTRKDEQKEEQKDGQKKDSSDS